MVPYPRCERKAISTLRLGDCPGQPSPRTWAMRRPRVKFFSKASLYRRCAESTTLVSRLMSRRPSSFSISLRPLRRAFSCGSP